MDKSYYQIIVLGALDVRFISLQKALSISAKNLGLSSNALVFLKESDLSNYDRCKPAVGIYFGHTNAAASPFLAKLLDDSIVVIPVVSSTADVSQELPASLFHVNALPDTSLGLNIPRLVSLVFEIFRLLRKERGVFISYRRKGSQPLANRLYEELDKRGFDVFIDTRSVPPAADFQAELWNRMSDVDVIVLIDTPGFREGRWTKAELAQANLLGIQTLHLLWPGQKEDPVYAFSKFKKLAPSDFNGPTPGRGATIKESVLISICDLAEELRAQATALRYTHLVDNFCDAARDLGLRPVVQPERWISVDLKHNNLAVVPAIGRLTSEQMNIIFNSIDLTDTARTIWVIYDSRGLHESWIGHLQWLDSYLPVKNLCVSKVNSALQDLS